MSTVKIFSDRKKDLVKLRHGEYIALGKIEAALKTSPLLTNLGIFVDSNELSCVAVAVGNEEQLTKIATANGITGDFRDGFELIKNTKKIFLISGNNQKEFFENRKK